MKTENAFHGKMTRGDVFQSGIETEFRVEGIVESVAESSLWNSCPCIQKNSDSAHG